MFKIGEYEEDYAKLLVDYLRDAHIKVDLRHFTHAIMDSTVHLEGRLSELKDLIKDKGEYERYLEAIKSALPSSKTDEEFRDNFLNEVDPRWKEMGELKKKYEDESQKLSEEEMDRFEALLKESSDWLMAYDFAENVLSQNEIEIGQDVGDKLNDPFLIIRLPRGGYDPDQKFLKREIEISIEKGFEVFVDEFSAPLFRDMDDDFSKDFPEAALSIAALGLLIEELVENPSEGKIDMESFADERCVLEFQMGKEGTSMTIDASWAAEEIAKVLEKNDVIKIKGDTIKWKR